MAERSIEYVKLDDLKADPKNPKSHSLDIIDASYDRFGVVDLITVDGRTGFIISGHGRTTVLRDMEARGEEAAPEGVRVDEDGSWHIPVNAGWSSKNDAEAAAALIAMNRVTEMGGWVDESLLSLLAEISASGSGFAGVGFSEVDMDDLQHLLEDVPDLDALADEYDPDDMPSTGTGGLVSVKLTDSGVIERWHEVRDQCKTDDEAARILFGMDAAPKAEKAKRKPKKESQPTPEDLEDEDDTPAALAASGLDWSTAATVPDGDTEDMEDMDDADDLDVDLDRPDEDEDEDER